MLMMLVPLFAKTVQSLGRAAMSCLGSMVGRSERDSERKSS